MLTNEPIQMEPSGSRHSAYLILLNTDSRFFFISRSMTMCFLKSALIASYRTAARALTPERVSLLFSKCSKLKCEIIIWAWLYVESVMIAQWNSSLSVLPVAQVQSPPRRSISRDFSLTDHTLSTSQWQKLAQSPLNGTTQPVDSEEEGQSPTTDKWWLIKKICWVNITQ